MEKELAEKIVAEIKNWANANVAFGKDNPTVSAQLKNLTSNDVSLGVAPEYRIAHIEGDVTAVGGTAEAEYNATMKRTEAFEFTTASFAYFENSKLSDVVVYRTVAMLEGIGNAVVDTFMGDYLPKPDVYADKAAKSLAEKSMKRLNMYLYSHRVNETTIVWETDYKESNFVPIYVNLKEPKKGEIYKTVVGFYAKDSGKLYLSDIQGLIKQQRIDELTSKSTRAKKGIKIAIGIIVAVGIAIAVVFTVLRM